MPLVDGGNASGLGARSEPWTVLRRIVLLFISRTLKHMGNAVLNNTCCTHCT